MVQGRLEISARKKSVPRVLSRISARVPPADSTRKKSAGGFQKSARVAPYTTAIICSVMLLSLSSMCFLKTFVDM